MTILNKQQVRRNFNTATNTYDAASDWQKNVGDLLLRYIDQMQPNGKTILDLGSGTSYLARHIQRHHPNNRLIALDIAECMLQFSKQHLNQEPRSKLRGMECKLLSSPPHPASPQRGEENKEPEASYGVLVNKSPHPILLPL